jgi:hypothetical protein
MQYCSYTVQPVSCISNAGAAQLNLIWQVVPHVRRSHYTYGIYSIVNPVQARCSCYTTKPGGTTGSLYLRYSTALLVPVGTAGQVTCSYCTASPPKSNPRRPRQGKV